MKKININNIKKMDFIECGSYGSIFEAYYGKKKLALKEFDDINYLNGKKKKIEKISDNIYHPDLIIPKYWIVDKKNNKNSYLTDFFCGDNLFNTKNNYSLKEKIMLLKKLKNIIIQMHNQGLIHGDLIPGNILTNKDCIKIIDFDNSSYNNSSINFNHLNRYSKDFIEHYGIIPEIDNFLFNILTYYLICDTPFYLVESKIRANDFKFFDNNKDAINICTSLLLENNNYNNEFLIDTIDESKIM